MSTRHRPPPDVRAATKLADLVIARRHEEAEALAKEIKAKADRRQGQRP